MFLITYWIDVKNQEYNIVYSLSSFASSSNGTFTWACFGYCGDGKKEQNLGLNYNPLFLSKLLVS
jgi:hypothetical protein